jgi:hypothetical protein
MLLMKNVGVKRTPLATELAMSMSTRAAAALAFSMAPSADRSAIPR